MAYFSRETANIVPYAVGNRIYGGGRPFPTIGPVDPLGYKERDLQTSARRDAALRKLKALQSGKFAGADALRTV
jgi:hypothetical protein